MDKTNTQTTTAIRALADAQLDAAIAEEVMGWHLETHRIWNIWVDDKGKWMYSIELWHPTRDLNQAWEAQETMKTRHITLKYSFVLREVCDDEGVEAFAYIFATARQRCEALLACVRKTKRDTVS